MDRNFIFYRSSNSTVSPMVSVNWPGKVVDLFNQLPATLWLDNHPERLCAEFVASCYHDQAIGLPSGVWSLSFKALQANELGKPWGEWMVQQADQTGSQPILVDLDPPYHVLSQGKVLCRMLGADEQRPGEPVWVKVEEGVGEKEAKKKITWNRDRPYAPKKLPSLGVLLNPDTEQAFQTVLFHNPDTLQLSPMVRVAWSGPTLDLLNCLYNLWYEDIPPGWVPSGDSPNEWCADFIAAYESSTDIGSEGISIQNLPQLEPFDDDGLRESFELHEEWRKWLFEVLAPAIEKTFPGSLPPILIETNIPASIHQGNENIGQTNRHWIKRNEPLWIPIATSVRYERTPAEVANAMHRSAEPPPNLPLPLYSTVTVEEALAGFGGPASAQFYCDNQFAIVKKSILCFTTIGKNQSGSQIKSPSEIDWKMSCQQEESSLPAQLTECVERNDKNLPLHHLFLRASTEEGFVYVGVAELPSIHRKLLSCTANYRLEIPLPRELWQRLGGYSGWKVHLNGTPHQFESDDLAGFEQVLSTLPEKPAYWELFITGYEEWMFRVYGQGERAQILFRPVRWLLHPTLGAESWDPDSPIPKQRLFYGERGSVVLAEQTVPREVALRAAVEYFRTGRLPDFIRWRAQIDDS